MAASKHVDLSLRYKVKILKELEAPGAEQVQVTKQFGVSTLQVSKMVKEKVDILRDFKTGANRTRNPREHTYSVLCIYNLLLCDQNIPIIRSAVPFIRTNCNVNILFPEKFPLYQEIPFIRIPILSGLHCTYLDD